jgi:PEP-CTERM putative exosortase interaction domain
MGVIGVGVVAVPEPSTSALMGIGVLAGLVGFTRRHWKKSEDRVSLAVVQ